MPDIVTHYAFSLLLSSRFVRLRYALVLAFMGVLPDIDVVFRVHRSLTHSLVLTAVPFLLVLVTLRHAKPGCNTFVLLGMALYDIHILMDLFIAPTPILWPLINASMTLNVEIYAILNSQGLELAPKLTLINTPCDFTQKPLLGGALLSTTGVITAVTTTSILSIEWLLSRKRLSNEEL